MATPNKTTAIMPADEATVARLDDAATALAECTQDMSGGLSTALRQAVAMGQLRALLTPEIMAPIVALQGNPLGFLTDKDREGGYREDVVRDVTIWAAGQGARMVGNEINIVSGRGYATKAYFARRLDETLGRGAWMFVHGVPEVKRGEKTSKSGDKFVGVVGAVLKTQVRWREKGRTEWQEQELAHAIKGDDYASADSYLGKADRKCGAWLLKRVVGRAVPDGDSEDAIPTTATPAADTPTPTGKPSAASLRQRPEPPPAQSEPDDLNLGDATQRAANQVP